MMKNKLYIILFLLLIGCSNKPKLRVSFDESSKIDIGTQVFIKGKKVGQISHLEKMNLKVVVTIDLIDGINIPNDSKYILDNDLLGNNFIAIELGEGLELVDLAQVQHGSLEVNISELLKNLDKDQYDSLMRYDSTFITNDSILNEIL